MTVAQGQETDRFRLEPSSSSESDGVVIGLECAASFLGFKAAGGGGCRNNSLRRAVAATCLDSVKV
jgi:hypothetical protein